MFHLSSCDVKSLFWCRMRFPSAISSLSLFHHFHNVQHQGCSITGIIIKAYSLCSLMRSDHDLETYFPSHLLIDKSLDDLALNNLAQRQQHRQFGTKKGSGRLTMLVPNFPGAKYQITSWCCILPGT